MPVQKFVCPRCSHDLAPSRKPGSGEWICTDCGATFRKAMSGLIVGSPGENDSSNDGNTSGTLLTNAGTTRDAKSVAQNTKQVQRDGKAGTSIGPRQPYGMLGRFELQEVLGQGAFGRVYRAYDPQLDRMVALKVPIFGDDEQKKAARFQAEAKSAARLRHPNIVPTFEAGRIGNQNYIATQYIPGRTLSKVIKEESISYRQAAYWTKCIASALFHAHQIGIIHRDVKPQNIMLDEHGEPQLMDFGLAKRVNEDSGATTEGTLLGTPAYMAPEQARGDLANVGPHSDQYAAAVLLYELLTGRRPFDGPPHAVLMSVVSTDPPSPRSIKSDIPPDLEAIVLKGMQKNFINRYPSCKEFADDLDRWLRGEAPSVRPAVLISKAPVRVQKTKSAIVPILLATGLSVALLGAVGYSAFQFASKPTVAKSDRSAGSQPVESSALKKATVSSLAPSSEKSRNSKDLSELGTPEAIRDLDPKSTSFERDVAKVLLDAGLKIVVIVNGEHQLLETATSIPDSDLTIYNIVMENRSFSQDEHFFELLPKLSGLSRFNAPNCTFSNEQITCVLSCPHLDELGLGGTSGFDKTGFQAIENLTELRVLDLTNTSLTVDDLEPIGKLSKIEALYIDNTNLDDRLLELVPRWPNLNAVRCPRSKITNVGLSHLAIAIKLHALDLRGTAVDDGSVDVLLGFSEMLELGLSEHFSSDAITRVLTNPSFVERGRRFQITGNKHFTNEHCRLLSKFAAMEEIWIEDTLVTEEGVEYLLGIPGLIAVTLTGTDLTPEQIERLKQRYPTVQIL